MGHSLFGEPRLDVKWVLFVEGELVVRTVEVFDDALRESVVGAVKKIFLFLSEEILLRGSDFLLTTEVLLRHHVRALLPTFNDHEVFGLGVTLWPLEFLVLFVLGLGSLHWTVSGVRFRFWPLGS